MLHGEWRYFWLGNMFDEVKFTEDGLGQQQRHRHLLLLNVGVLRGVCGVGFEGRRSLLNNSVRRSNLAEKGTGGMAMVLGDQG